jgi:hypothetical protein
VGRIGSLIARTALSQQRKAQAQAAQTEGVIIRANNAALDAYVNLLADQVQQRAEAIRQGRGTIAIFARQIPHFARLKLLRGPGQLPRVTAGTSSARR